MSDSRERELLREARNRLWMYGQCWTMASGALICNNQMDKEVIERIDALLAQPPAPPAGENEHECFDMWMQNPYTKVLMKSIKEDYVPRPSAAPAQPEQGWVRVPVEPTQAMITEGVKAQVKDFKPLWVFLADDGLDSRALVIAYKAMLAALSDSTKERK